jgi:hypothetical protein
MPAQETVSPLYGTDIRLLGLSHVLYSIIDACIRTKSCKVG